jgi:RNA polymerase sigma factor (sigma-70 family)
MTIARKRTPFSRPVFVAALSNERNHHPVECRSDAPAELTDSEWVRWRVHQAVRKLPEHQRELIELAYWSGFSASEIANRLNIPVGIFMVQVRSALSDLSRLLDRNPLHRRGEPLP